MYKLKNKKIIAQLCGSPATHRSTESEGNLGIPRTLSFALSAATLSSVRSPHTGLS